MTRFRPRVVFLRVLALRVERGKVIQKNCGYHAKSTFHNVSLLKVEESASYERTYITLEGAPKTI